MPCLIVPGVVKQTSAELWIGCIDEKAPVASSLTYGNTRVQFDHQQWQPWPPGSSARVHFRRHRLDNLQPNQRYVVDFDIGPRKAAQAEVRTLPNTLPTAGAKPFRILLGACHCYRNDGGLTDTTFQALPEKDILALKVLCGDQVYLDSPWYRYVGNEFTEGALQQIFFDTYADRWLSKRGGAEGPNGTIRSMLTVGSNFFGADDHELYNNAPNFAPWVTNSWREGPREAWIRAAKAAYDVFQRHPNKTLEFEIGKLSFRFPDTRMERNPTGFMTDADLLATREWVEGLTGPGILVLSQPLFQTPAGRIGRALDKSLPDYEQYAALAGILARTTRSILILTGDVHFGRVAVCRLPNGAEIVEVISSPMALVSSVAEGKFKEAPRFPPMELAGLTAGRMETRGEMRGEHFTTLDLWQQGESVRLDVSAWPISGRSAERIPRKLCPQPIILR